MLQVGRATARVARGLAPIGANLTGRYAAWLPNDRKGREGTSRLVYTTACQYPMRYVEMAWCR